MKKTSCSNSLIFPDNKTEAMGTMLWYEQYNQDWGSKNYELQLGCTILSSRAQKTEFEEMTTAIRNWLHMRRSSVSGIYLAVTTKGKYRKSVMIYWNTLIDRELKIHSSTYKPMSARLDIIDSATDKRVTYNTKTMESSFFEY